MHISGINDVAQRKNKCQCESHLKTVKSIHKNHTAESTCISTLHRPTIRRRGGEQKNGKQHINALDEVAGIRTRWVLMLSDYAVLFILLFFFLFGSRIYEVWLILVIWFLWPRENPVSHGKSGSWIADTTRSIHTCCVGVYKPFKRNTFSVKCAPFAHAEHRPDNNNICFDQQRIEKGKKNEKGRGAADYIILCTICFAWTTFSHMIDFTWFSLARMELSSYFRCMHIRSRTD